METDPKNSRTGVLLVEDEALIALQEERTLHQAGYSVLRASTGERAIETVRDPERSQPIDLILMDINLGDGMDGTEAALEILRTHAIPVLFLSGHTEQEIVERTEKITSYGYTAEEAIGHKLWELIIPPEMVSDVKQAVHHMASI